MQVPESSNSEVKISGLATMLLECFLDGPGVLEPGNLGFWHSVCPNASLMTLGSVSCELIFPELGQMCSGSFPEYLYVYDYSIYKFIYMQVCMYRFLFHTHDNESVNSTLIYNANAQELMSCFHVALFGVYCLSECIGVIAAMGSAHMAGWI